MMFLKVCFYPQLALYFHKCPYYYFAIYQLLYRRSHMSYSSRYKRCPTQQQLPRARRVFFGQQPSDLSRISNWNIQDLFSMPQKLSFIFLLDNLPSNYDIFVLSWCFFFQLSFWKDHIIFLTKQALKLLGVIKRFQDILMLPQLFPRYMHVAHPYGIFLAHMGQFHRHRVKDFHLIDSYVVIHFLKSIFIHRNIVLLSLRYHYYKGHCCSEFSSRILPPSMACAIRLSPLLSFQCSTL